MPVGGGGAWPGFETTRRAEGSRRGRLAGGPPPTGTQSSPAHKTCHAVPGTPAGPQATTSRKAAAHRHTQRPGTTGVEGAGGTGGHGRASRRGLAAVPVGGGGAWPGFETTRRAKLAARTARGRAAAHGHTKQPGPTKHTRHPEHQRRYKQRAPDMRKPRPADAGRGFRYPVGYEV